ncbi:MAG: hypothetical protein IJS88_03210 [Alphaproteobacteria bacterium]|nr:hypothetical protein [Alphaproteobacteria bacterium]
MDIVILGFVDFIIQRIFIKMEKKHVLDHAFCSKYRKEIKAYGLQQAIRDLLTSTNKVELKKQYLAREVEKKESFKADFVAACDSIISADRKLMPAVRAIQKVIIA